MATIADIREKMTKLQEYVKELETEVEEKSVTLSSLRTEGQKADVIRWKTFREMDTLERKLTELQTKVSEKEERLIEVQKSVIECQRLTDNLSKAAEANDETYQKLKDKKDTAKIEASEVSSSLILKIEHLQDLQNVLQQTEREAEKLSCAISELQEENSIVCSKLPAAASRSAEINARIDVLEKRHAELTERVLQANQRTLDACQASEEFSVQLADLEDEANDWMQKSKKLRQQIDHVKVTIEEAA